MRNPDPSDSRRYLAVVDRKPLPYPQWTIKAAQSAAIRAVEYDKADRLFAKRGRKPQDVLDRETQQPEPAPQPEPIEEMPQLPPDFGLEDLPPAPAPDEQPPYMAPAQYADFTEAPADERRDISASINLKFTTTDTPAALVALQSAIDLLRELCERPDDCEARVNLPPMIRM
jgi:hypothetical protein